MGTTPQMPRDFGPVPGQGGHGEPVQVLAPTGPAFQIAIVEGASARVTVGVNRIVMIFADVNARYRFGDGAVVAADDATSDPLTSGQDRYFSTGAATDIAAISRVGAGGGVFFVRVLE